MAQRTVVPRAFTFPIPESVNDETAAALPNPGISAWLSLAYRAKLVRGENVLILGATGVTGKLAVKIATILAPLGLLAPGVTKRHYTRSSIWAPTRPLPSLSLRMN